MATKRKQYTAASKAQVALAALKGNKTINELAGQFGVHPTLIQDGKKYLLSTAEQVFANGVKADTTVHVEAQKAERFEQIGRLKRELEGLKKKSDLSADQRRQLIDAGHPRLSVRRPCQLLGLNRSSLYYQPTNASEETLRRMRLIDQEYTAHPFLGSRRLTRGLMEQGEEVNRKRVQRRMRLRGLEALYPKPQLSAAGRGHRIYPYLLRNVSIERADQVWSTDIIGVVLLLGGLVGCRPLCLHPAEQIGAGGVGQVDALGGQVRVFGLVVGQGGVFRGSRLFGETLMFRVEWIQSTEPRSSHCSMVFFLFPKMPSKQQRIITIF
jgi:putative transposase